MQLEMKFYELESTEIGPRKPQEERERFLSWPRSVWSMDHSWVYERLAGLEWSTDCRSIGENRTRWRKPSADRSNEWTRSHANRLLLTREMYSPSLYLLFAAALIVREIVTKSETLWECISSSRLSSSCKCNIVYRTRGGYFYYSWRSKVNSVEST